MTDLAPKVVHKGSTASKTIVKFQGSVYRYGDFLAFKNRGLPDGWARLAATMIYEGVSTSKARSS